MEVKNSNQHKRLLGTHSTPSRGTFNTKQKKSNQQKKKNNELTIQIFGGRERESVLRMPTNIYTIKNVVNSVYVSSSLKI